MDSTRYSRAKEALKKQNSRSGNLKDCKAHAGSAEAESSRAWTSSGPSPLRDSDNERAELNATDGPRPSMGTAPRGSCAWNPTRDFEIFLPRLLKALERKGLSEAAVVFAWKSVLAGAKQPPIKTVEHYQIAWSACDTASDILTTLDDGSEAAAWCSALTHRIFDFEGTYKAKHGHRPLSPGGPDETEGPRQCGKPRAGKGSGDRVAGD